MDYNSLSEKEQIKYIRMHGAYEIANIENPSLEVQLAAVQENGYAIEYINDPNKDIVVTSMLKIM